MRLHFIFNVENIKKIFTIFYFIRLTRAQLMSVPISYRFRDKGELQSRMHSNTCV